MPLTPICNEKITEGCVSPPQVVFHPEPEYSEEVREAKYQGTCIIGLIVEADGSTSHVTLISGVGIRSGRKSSGYRQKVEIQARH